MALGALSGGDDGLAERDDDDERMSVGEVFGTDAESRLVAAQHREHQHGNSPRPAHPPPVFTDHCGCDDEECHAEVGRQDGEDRLRRPAECRSGERDRVNDHHHQRVSIG